MKIEADAEAKIVIKAQIDASLKMSGLNAFGDALKTLMAIGELVYEPGNKETQEAGVETPDEKRPAEEAD